MDFKDYYAALCVERGATQDEVKRAYRKLARKYHPDVSKEADAEERFKAVAEAHEALIDPERRAAYDELARKHEHGQPFEPPPGWDSGFEYSGRGGRGEARPGAGQADFSEFFESLFGHANGRAGHGRAQHRRTADVAEQGADHHAKVEIELRDAYRGAQRSLSLRMPVFDAEGRSAIQDRQLDVVIPKGVREGQHLRLAGQGAPGHGGGPPGDLYLEIRFRPEPGFRVDGRDVYLDLPVTPAEAALGGPVTLSTPDGQVALTIPPGSAQGRKLRLKGKGLPGANAGDLYAVLVIALPPADSDAASEAYRAFARAFPGFDPRIPLEA